MGLSTAVPIQRGWYQLDAVPFECGMSTLGKEYAILLKTKTKTETRIKTMRQKRENAVVLMKLYNTDFFASIGVHETNTQISMTINGKIVVFSIPSDFKISECSEDFLEGDTLADWLARNGKEV